MDKRTEKYVAYLVLVFLVISIGLFLHAIFNAFYVPQLPSDFYRFQEKFNVDIKIQNALNEDMAAMAAQRDNVSHDKVEGIFLINKSKISIYVLNKRNKNDLLMHEMGHIVWNVGLNQDERTKYEEIWSKLNDFNKFGYAVDTPEENFAESFKCYHSKWMLCYFALSREQKEFMQEKITTTLA